VGAFEKRRHELHPNAPVPSRRKCEDIKRNHHYWCAE